MMDIPKIEIPALRADGTTPRIVVPAGERAGVLIVDDTPSKLVALAAIVSGMALEIVTASSGEQALRQLLKRDFAVILLDVNMPTMDGFETATLIRSRPRSEHTPIIFVTAEANSEAERLSGYTLGAVDFIYSPIIPEILRTKVRVFVDLYTIQRQLLLHTEELKARQQELANANQALIGLYRIAEGLNRAVSEREVVEAALERALELPGVQAGWIVLREGESGFRLAAARNLPPALEAPGALEGDCLCRRQLLAGELGAVNILECERLGKTKGDTRGLRYHASVPLWLGDRTLGVLNLVRPQEGVFKEEELKVLHGVGQQVAVALERAWLHDRLNDSENRFRVMFERTADALLLLDPGSGQFIDCNQAAADLLRCTDKKEILLLHPAQISPLHQPDGRRSAEKAAEMIATAMSNGSHRFEWIHCSDHREDFPAEVLLTLILMGERQLIIATVRDITERKRTEAALQHELVRHQETARELFDARVWLAETDRQEAVGRLAAGVAHEVKNPLAIIRLGIDYLSKEFARESTQGAVLSKVQEAAVRADSIITDLMQFSRQKSLARHPTQINAVVDNAINLVSHEITVRNIDIVRSYDDSMPPILADPDQLAQVFVNLLTNAAQAIGQGGRIEVVTRSICLSERDLERDKTRTFKIGERVITAEIRDNGSGVSPDNQKKLFEPFFTTKPIGEGTGLGLAVSRNIVIMHAGSINLSNRSEGGASALLMFPVAIEG